MRRRHDANRMALRAVMVLAVAVAAGATQNTPDAPDAEPAQEQSQELPSLDALLGITEEPDRSAADAADRDVEDELERELAEIRITDAFALALEKMSISADLLDLKLDSGLGTQRVQEEILSKLDQVIDQAQQMQAMGAGASGSGSSRKRQSSPSKPAPGQPRPGGQQQSQSQDSQAGGPPPRQDGDINTVMEESRTEWGHLPDRIREMLIQGLNDKYSSLYRRLTEEYYQRLAEEG